MEDHKAKMAAQFLFELMQSAEVVTADAKQIRREMGRLTNQLDEKLKALDAMHAMVHATALAMIGNQLALPLAAAMSEHVGAVQRTRFEQFIVSFHKSK